MNGHRHRHLLDLLHSYGRGEAPYGRHQTGDFDGRPRKDEHPAGNELRLLEWNSNSEANPRGAIQRTSGASKRRA